MNEKRYKVHVNSDMMPFELKKGPLGLYGLPLSLMIYGVILV
jgi:hypothetical protein